MSQPFKSSHPLAGFYDNQYQSATSSCVGRAKETFDGFILRSLWFPHFIETCKSLLAFLPGRFSAQNLSGEALYTLLTLIGQYNDRVLGKPSFDPYAIRTSSCRDVCGKSNAESTTMRTINHILTFCSTFESLLEQVSGYIYNNHINVSAKSLNDYNIGQRIQALMQAPSMINIVSNYLPISHKIDPNSLHTIDPSIVNNTDAVIQPGPQYKRGPHLLHRSQFQHRPSETIHEDSSANSLLMLEEQEASEHLYHYGLSDKYYNIFKFKNLQHISQLFRFRMTFCFGVEVFKFMLRMIVLFYANYSSINMPNQFLDIAVQQHQHSNETEYKKYKSDQFEIRKYIARVNKKNPAVNRTPSAPSPAIVAESTDITNLTTLQPTAADITPITVPVQQSSFTSHLTSAPFKPNANQRQIQQQFQYDSSNTSIDFHSESQTALSASMNANNKQAPDLRSIKSIKLLYLYTHRGTLSHGLHALNLVETYLTHYHHPQSADIVDAIVPSKLFIDYALSLFKKTPSQTYNTTELLREPLPTPNTPLSFQNFGSMKTLQSTITLPTALASEVMYWARPVLYTALTVFCNRVPDTIAQLTEHKWYHSLFISYQTNLQSAIPTIVSMIMDFLALYASPAWDPKVALETLLEQQQDEVEKLKQLQLSQHTQPPSDHDSVENFEKPTHMISSSQSQIRYIHPLAVNIMKSQHTLQLEHLQMQLSTWEQRKSNYWLYLLRPPFITLFLINPLQWLADKLNNVPFIGGVLQLIVSLLRLLHQWYFYLKL